MECVNTLKLSNSTREAEAGGNTELRERTATAGEEDLS